MPVKPAHVLVITPHPDDAEFGVAGTVARWTREGKDVVYVVCTNGDKGSDDPQVESVTLAKMRQREQLDAARVLGVREVKFLGHPDQELEDTPAFRKELVRLIRTYRPEIVITSDPYRRYVWHRDHRIAGQVALDAIFPYSRDRLACTDLQKEGLGPHKVKEVWLWAPEEGDINYRSNISDTFEIKIQALLCHQSQVGKYSPEDLREFLRQRHQQFAQGQEYELAEAFHREEMVEYGRRS